MKCLQSLLLNYSLFETKDAQSSINGFSKKPEENRRSCITRDNNKNNNNNHKEYMGHSITDLVQVD